MNSALRKSKLHTNPANGKLVKIQFRDYFNITMKLESMLPILVIERDIEKISNPSVV